MYKKHVKQELVSNGSYDESRKIARESYKNQTEFCDDLIRAGFSPEQAFCLVQMAHALKAQRARAKKFVRYYNSRYEFCYFLTLTVSEEYLCTHTISAWEKYINRMLNNMIQSDILLDYMGNIDYGSENDRVHYHYFLVCSKELDLNYVIRTSKKTGQKFMQEHWLCDELEEYENKIGDIENLHCKKSSMDSEKIGNYVGKLSNHALKVKQSSIKYPRGKNTPIRQYEQCVKLYRLKLKWITKPTLCPADDRKLLENAFGKEWYKTK